jgi:hypothetical protein
MTDTGTNEPSSRRLSLRTESRRLRADGAADLIRGSGPYACPAGGADARTVLVTR